MKRAGLIPRKILTLMLIAVMLVGFLPLTSMAADTANINITAAEDQTGVTATFNNPTSASVSVSLIFAAYGKNGKLSYTKEYPLTAGANASVTQKFDFDFTAQPDCIIKLFAWDGTGFIPFCKEMSSSYCVTIDGSNATYDGVGLNVIADPAVTGFTFVMIDQFTKRGAAFTAEKINKMWSHAKVEGMDVIIAYKPAEFIGSALPEIEVTDLRAPNGVNITRVIVSQ
jgi:hypothetical protein